MKLRGMGKVKAIARRLRNTLAPGGLILMYHRVTEVEVDPWGLCVSPQHFAEHLAVLRQWAHPVSLQQMTQGLDSGQSIHRTVALTFDDGYADNLLQAKPILERYDIPATVFVATGYVDRGHEYWWDELERLCLQPGTLPPSLELTLPQKTYRWNLESAATYSLADYRHHQGWYAEAKVDPTPRHSLYRGLWQLLLPLVAEQQQDILSKLWDWAGTAPPVRPTHRPMTPAEVTALDRDGLVEVGSHTVMHPFLSALPLPLQRDEIHQGKDRLEALLEHPIRSFAYPYGNFAPATVDLIREAGFDRACSVIPARVDPRCDRWQLPRVEVLNWDGDTFAKRLRRWFDV